MLQRLQHALSALRGDMPRALSNSRKSAPYVFPLFVNGQPQWHLADFAAYVAEGYSLNSIIYSAVNYKARAIGKARLRAYTGDPENPELLPANHPLSLLCARPNPHQSWVEFQQQRETYLNIAGNSYTWLDRPSRDARPTALWNLRPDRVFIVPETRSIKGYLYVPENQPQQRMPLLPKDIIHVKFPNPGDPLEGLGYGLSPMAPLAQSGDVDNSITAFLKLFIEHGAMVSGIIKLKEPAIDEEVARIRRRWREQYGGMENWTDIAVLDVDSEYQRIGLDFEEMAFEKLDSRNESRMLGPFGVPPQLIFTRYGLERNTFSNAEEARKALWEDTLLPELDLFYADDDYYLRSDDGAFVLYDTSGIPALQKNVPELIKAAETLWHMGTPLNQAVAAVGLKLEDIPGGDIGYLPLSVAQVGMKPVEPVEAEPVEVEAAPVADDTGQEDAASADNEEREDTPKAKRSSQLAKAWSADEKARLWKAADEIAVSHEAAFRKAAVKQFGLDKREILALVTDAKRKSLARKAAIQWEDLEADVRGTLQAAGERWREAFTPLMAGVVEDAAEHWKAELGLAFDVRNLEAEAWFSDYTAKFSTPIQDTSERQISAMLQQGQREGWSVPQMQGGLTQMFQQWIAGDVDAADFAGERLPSYRTEAIARTETQRSYAAGTQQIYKSAGVEHKEWLSTTDGREREEHALANGQVVKVDEPFIVGGEALDFPGDPSGSPGNVINCRCTLIPVLEDPNDVDELLDEDAVVTGGSETTVATLDGAFPPDEGTPGETLDELNAFLQQSNGPLSYALADPMTGMLSVDLERADDYFLINREVVKKEAATFVRESQDIKYSREYLLQLAQEHALENDVEVEASQLEALYNRHYATRAEAIQTLADIDNIRLTEAQQRRLQTAMSGSYLDMVYSTQSSEAGSLANAAGRRGGQKLSGSALREARRNFQDWVQGIDTV